MNILKLIAYSPHLRHKSAIKRLFNTFPRRVAVNQQRLRLSANKMHDIMHKNRQYDPGSHITMTIA